MPNEPCCKTRNHHFLACRSFRHTEHHGGGNVNDDAPRSASISPQRLRPRERGYIAATFLTGSSRPPRRSPSLPLRRSSASQANQRHASTSHVGKSSSGRPAGPRSWLHVKSAFVGRPVLNTTCFRSTHHERKIHNTMSFPAVDSLGAHRSLPPAADSFLVVSHHVVHSPLRRRASALHLRRRRSPQTSLAIGLRSSESDMPFDSSCSPCDEPL